MGHRKGIRTSLSGRKVREWHLFVLTFEDLQKTENSVYAVQLIDKFPKRNLVRNFCKISTTESFRTEVNERYLVHHPDAAHDDSEKEQ